MLQEFPEWWELQSQRRHSPSRRVRPWIPRRSRPWNPRRFRHQPIRFRRRRVRLPDGAEGVDSRLPTAIPRQPGGGRCLGAADWESRVARHQIVWT